VWCDALAPVDTREIYDWAEEHIELPHSYAVPGPFRVQSSRYLVEPFRALRDHGVRKVTISKATQTGGSLLFDIAIPWHAVNNPGPILLAMSTDEVATDHMQSRILPVMRSCRALQPILPSDPRLLTKCGVMFPHMPFWAYGSAPAKLQSKSVLFAIADEAWLWEPGRLQWLEARVSAFARVGLSKLLRISQPGDAGDDHDMAWRAGTDRR
jgi:phage terminase large subunit GpA-like protein